MAGGVDSAFGVLGREGSAEFTTVDVGLSVMVALRGGREALRSSQNPIRRDGVGDTEQLVENVGPDRLKDRASSTQ